MVKATQPIDCCLTNHLLTLLLMALLLLQTLKHLAVLLWLQRHWVVPHCWWLLHLLQHTAQHTTAPHDRQSTTPELDKHPVWYPTHADLQSNMCNTTAIVLTVVATQIKELQCPALEDISSVVVSSPPVYYYFCFSASNLSTVI